MKNILLLTDYTPASAQAAQYALRLAKRINANIIVSDSLLVPEQVLVLMGDAIGSELEAELPQAQDKLAALCYGMEQHLIANTFPGSFVPGIYCQSGTLPVAEAIRSLEEKNDIVFIILAANLYYGSHSIMAGETCGTILRSSRTPVIAVPESALVRVAEKYTCITDITNNNGRYLGLLADLASYSAAELMLVNINNGRPLDHEQEQALKALMKEMIDHVDYGRMYYRYVPNEAPETDMEWLFKCNRFEALAMVYPKKELYKRVLRFDYQERMIGNIDVPVFIFPSE